MTELENSLSQEANVEYAKERKTRLECEANRSDLLCESSGYRVRNGSQGA